MGVSDNDGYTQKYAQKFAWFIIERRESLLATELLVKETVTIKRI